MKAMRIIALLGLGLTVSACATIDTPTRNAPFEELPTTAVTVPAGYLTEPAVTPQPLVQSAAVVAPQATRAVAAPVQPQLVQSPVRISSVIVRVPRSLKVSEANRYLPGGDIVWREDPIGDRHAQVQKIFETAFLRTAEQLNGPVPIQVDVQVRKFHALTEKARYTVGGVHAITFDLAIKDEATGQLLTPIRTIRADLDAFGGQQALQAEARGLTQKVRITGHLSEVLRQELTNPSGYQNASLGLIQVLNQM